MLLVEVWIFQCLSISEETFKPEKRGCLLILLIYFPRCKFKLWCFHLFLYVLEFDKLLGFLFSLIVSQYNMKASKNVKNVFKALSSKPDFRRQ